MEAAAEAQVSVWEGGSEVNECEHVGKLAKPCARPGARPGPGLAPQGCWRRVASSGRQAIPRWAGCVGGLTGLQAGLSRLLSPLDSSCACVVLSTWAGRTETGPGRGHGKPLQAAPRDSRGRTAALQRVGCEGRGPWWAAAVARLRKEEERRRGGLAKASSSPAAPHPAPTGPTHPPTHPRPQPRAWPYVAQVPPLPSTL